MTAGSGYPGKKVTGERLGRYLNSRGTIFLSGSTPATAISRPGTSLPVQPRKCATRGAEWARAVAAYILILGMPLHGLGRTRYESVTAISLTCTKRLLPRTPINSPCAFILRLTTPWEVCG